jgi:hypothetical protein
MSDPSHLIELNPTFFVRRLTQAVDALCPPVKRSLETTVSRDPKFKKELQAWAVKQGIAHFGDEAFYETVSRQIVYRILGKILFYQSLLRHAKALPPLNLRDIDPALVKERLRDAFEQARRIDYQAVFEEAMPERVPFPQPAVGELVRLTDDLNRFNFAEMPQDVVGQVVTTVVRIFIQIYTLNPSAFLRWSLICAIIFPAH